MGECSEKGCCPDKEKKSGCEEKGEMTDFFLEIADCAWSEVLKDKIKEHILATQNDRMTELAKIVSEGNNQRWRHRMEKKQGCCDFKEKLARFFGQFKK